MMDKVPTLLQGLKHSFHTDLKKGRITNADATLLIIASSESLMMKVGQIQRILRKWRGQDLAFTYLFNTSRSSGYGFTGLHPESPGQKIHMWRSQSPRAYRIYRQYRMAISESERLEIGRKRDAELAKDDYSFFRKHLWYRVKHGHYGISVAGGIRLAELLAQARG